MTRSVLDPYANAPTLPFASGRDWLGKARDLWLQHWLFFLTGSLLVLVARWQLDIMESGFLIALSYFTDAILLALIYFALREHQAKPESPALLFAWRLKNGRLKEVALCGLWGLPAAAASFLLLLFGPEVIKSLVFLLGSTVFGLLAMLAFFLVGGFAAFLASLLPNLAAIQAVRDPDSNFKSAGLWAFRGLRSGWRPLAIVFITFITASFAAGALLTPVFGHLPADVFTDNANDIELLFYWFPWPGLFIAMNVYLALLFPMADDLMRAADHDLSDEVLDPTSRERTGTEFVVMLIEKAGFAIASLSVFGFLFWTLANLLMMGSGYADLWLAAAVIGFLWSRSFYKSAQAWRDGRGRWARYRFLWMLPIWLVVVALFIG